MSGQYSGNGTRVTGGSKLPASKINTDWTEAGQRILSSDVGSSTYKEEHNSSEEYLKSTASGSLHGTIRKEPDRGNTYSLQITDARETPVLYLRTNSPGIYFLEKPETVGVEIFRNGTSIAPSSDGIMRLEKVTKNHDAYTIASSLLNALKDEEQAIDCKTPEGFWAEIKGKNITPIII
ncbi:MAG: hypothetical protein KAJ24_02370 [Candidatus Aenigmarchaeota archaeon]|nr:hypothetical protein [Candidatus Aenigmarchaeota archaeon]